MKTIQSIPKMQELVKSCHRDGNTIGLVPTMGCLHEGHLSLIRAAREASEVVVVSLFVNPTQFSPNEDYDQYPRDLERDTALCEENGVDLLFCPDAESMYSPDASFSVQEESISKVLCGKSRPSHFTGVTTVVAKLFNIIQPDIAVFGQKDAQQAGIIAKMVEDLNFSIEIVICPIVREVDGLAMSSRNKYLSPEERKRALGIYRSLCMAKELIESGINQPDKVMSSIKDQLSEDGIEIDYVEILDYSTFNKAERIGKGTLIAIAANIGTTRLIDNIII